MSAGKRYKFNGSKFRIQTGVGPAIPITGVTNAEPAEVAAVNTLQLGDVVRIQGSMLGLDDELFAVDNPDANSFELAGSNSTTYPAFVLNNPNTAQALPAVFSDFCELTGVDQQDGTADEIEVTTICSTAKEFEIGLADSGTITLNFNLAPNSPMQAALRASRKTAELLAFQIAFPKRGGWLVAFGYVTSTSFSGSNGGVWTGSAGVKLTGAIAVFEAE